MGSGAHSAPARPGVSEALRNLLASTRKIIVGINKGKKDDLRITWSHGTLTLAFTVKDLHSGTGLKQRLVDIASAKADQLLRLAQFSGYEKITSIASIALGVLYSLSLMVARGNNTVYMILTIASALLLMLGIVALRNTMRINKLKKEDPQEYARLRQQVVDFIARIITAPLDTATSTRILVEGLGLYQVKQVKKRQGKHVRIELARIWSMWEK